MNQDSKFAGGRFKPAARTYVRPTAGWWLKNPYFVRYMIREGSAVLLTAYALVLLVGLVRLHQGAVAFDGWRAALATPLSIVFHLVALAVVSYHSLTWFQVMPKTAPQLPIDPRWVTVGGLAAAGALSVLLLAVLWWVTR
jgi:fumarate reductase subunit C